MKKLTAIFWSIIIAFAGLIFFVLFGGNIKTPTNPQFAPTPTQILLQPTSISLPVMISTDPKNGMTNIPLNKKIIIVFDHAILQNRIHFDISPHINYSLSVNNNIITISPKSLLDPNTMYVFFVGDDNQSFYVSSSFSTITDPNQMTFDNIAQINAITAKNQYPDIYIMSKLPYETTTFTAKAVFTSNPSQHFYFVLTAKTGDTNRARNDFILWVKSLGITDAQISTLDIRFE